MQYFVTLSCVLFLAIRAQASLWDIIGSINITDLLENSDGLVRLALPLTNDEKLALGYAEDTVLNFTSLVTKYGYEAAEYTVTTEDGYILTLFRMWSSSCTSRGTPVLWMHGLMMSSDALVAGGVGSALGYHLADNCYDVWAGNNRGNYYSRAHTTLDPDVDSEYWQHSADEMATYDLPAMIDFILNSTGYSSVNYIGFSQGLGLAMMMCADRPEQCSKLSLVMGMSPATRLVHTRSAGAGLLIGTYGLLYPTFTSLNIYEVLFKGSIMQTLLEYSCQMAGTSDLLFTVCQNFLYILDSNNVGSIPDETFPLVYTGFPGGVSTRTMARYAQAAASYRLMKFDYGNETLNLAAYGSTTAPEYDLSLVTAPLVMLYGRGDHIMDPRDTLWAAAQVPNLLGVHEIGNLNWNHFDFVYSQYFSTYVLPITLQYLAQYTMFN